MSPAQSRNVERKPWEVMPGCSSLATASVAAVVSGLFFTPGNSSPSVQTSLTNASASLLGKPADKDDCADQVVTMCRTNTTTGQTLVIDSGRVFH